MIVEVALPIPIDRTYTYAVPEPVTGGVGLGSCVRVPFGNQSLVGVVVRVPERPTADVALREIAGVPDDVGALTAEMLQLTRWIADYYVCSWGEAIRAALPPGRQQKGGGRSKIEYRLQLSPSYGNQAALDALRSALRGPKQRAVVEVLIAMHAQGVSQPAQSDVAARAGCSAATINALVERGVVERMEVEVMRSPFNGLPAPMRDPLKSLHASQARALSEIEEALAAGSFRTFLLHGVTGSGKTEVYIEALKATLKNGRTGIILVPEISLTPQTVERFRAHFGDGIAVLHSRMSGGERYDAWRRLREGAFRIAIGPRSAILAPVPDLGLVVVDEEHEASYKQFDPAPRYHARDVAVMRASLNGAVCILGSATPSLESYVNTQTGKYRLLEMPDRVPGLSGRAGSLPTVQVVDLVLERKKHRLIGAFSQTLLEAMDRRLRSGEQIILLQNRRGFAMVVECQACGWVPECPDCSVSLTYHQPRDLLKCHYCGRTRTAPARCPSCGADTLSRHGIGTQRVEQELSAHFPEARVIRMDFDTTTRKHAHHRLLERFRRGEADVLLGTQMVAKGLDFPRVTLVGVINADTGLLMPDFRADERTFQLLTQVAGRAGRAELPGEVFFQTRHPDHPAVQCATRHDYQGFVDAAMSERRAFRWPPFSRVVMVEFRGTNEEATLGLAAAWTAAFRERVPEARTYDPVPALVRRVKRQHRFRTIVRASRKLSGEVRQGLREATAAAGRPPRGTRIAIDVDALDTV